MEMEANPLDWNFVQAIWVLLSITFEEATPEFKALGIGMKQMVFLAILDKQNTPRQLREVFAAPASTISNHINDLEKKGMVVRDIHPVDRRQYVLRRTPAGESALAVGIQEVNRVLAAKSQSLAPDELAAFAKVQEVLTRWMTSPE